jgi:hypothetical protein
MGWKVQPSSEDHPVVTAVFDGHLTAEEGIASAAAFKAAFGDRPLEVVWDVSGMIGFESGARTAWAETVWPLRGRISRLRIVGARGLVRIGATFLALLLGKPYEFVEATEPARRQVG